MASFDAQVAEAEQGGRMAQLEGHLQTVVFELQRLQSVVSQNAQDALNVQNAQNIQNAQHQFVPPPHSPSCSYPS